METETRQSAGADSAAGLRVKADRLSPAEPGAVAKGAADGPPFGCRTAGRLPEEIAGAGDDSSFFRHGLANMAKKSDTTGGVDSRVAPLYRSYSNEMPKVSPEMSNRFHVIERV